VGVSSKGAEKCTILVGLVEATSTFALGCCKQAVVVPVYCRCSAMVRKERECGKVGLRLNAISAILQEKVR
jgi:hypothetical protein